MPVHYIVMHYKPIMLCGITGRNPSNYVVTNHSFPIYIPERAIIVLSVYGALLFS